MKPRLYDWNFLIAFFAQTAFTITNSLLAHYSRWVEYLGGSVTDVGHVSAVSAIVGLAARPFLAPWIDRIGPRACWCIAGSVVIVATLANLAVGGVGFPLYFVRSATSIGIAVVFACGLTYIAQATPPERRTEAIGVLGAGGFAGLLIGPWLGDVFLGHVPRTAVDFQWFFLAAALGVGVSMALVPWLRPCPKNEDPPGWHPIEFVRAVRQHWPGPIFIVTLAFGVCMTVPFVFLAVFVDKLAGVRLWWFFVVYASVGLSIRLGLRSWPDQFGARRVLTVGMLCFAAGMWSFLLVTTQYPVLIFLAGAICGAGHGLTFHAMVALVLEPFPSTSRGAGSTLSLMGIDTGTFAGSQCLAYVADHFGFTALFHCVAVTCVVSLAVFLWPPGGRVTAFEATADPSTDNPKPEQSNTTRDVSGKVA